MSSIFFNNFYKDCSQKEKLEIVEDFYEGDSLQYFKKRYVNELDEISQLIDWTRLYESSNYLEFCMRSYTNYIKPVTRLKGFSKKLSKEEVKKIKDFYKLNNWRTIFNQIGKCRKLYGDCYVYWYLSSEKIPILRIIPAKYMEIMVGLNQEPIAYVFKKTIYWDDPIENSALFMSKTKSLKIIFRKGVVETYENDALISKELNDISFKNEIPILHFQFEKLENEPYSIIPSEDLIDSCLTLDRVETDISDINHCAGSPVQIITDGKVNLKHSRIGANAIMYVDTLANSKNQAVVSQFEITNSLESLYREREEKLFMLFTKSNLIPPEIIKIISKSDSSKVVSAIKESLSDELKDFYEEISEKTKILFKALMPNRKSEDISLEIPSEILNVTMQDKAILIKSGVNTLQDHLRSTGKTEEEIDQHLEEIKQQNIAFTTTVKDNEYLLGYEEQDIQDITGQDSIGEESQVPTKISSPTISTKTPETKTMEKPMQLNMDNKLK